jgi:ribonuclease Z
VIHLTVLGSGSTNPSPERFGSAFLLSVDDEHLLFDCGPAATSQLVKAGVQPTEVDYLFFTHHHYDHDVDYPCFLMCRWDQGAGLERPLTVRGPALTERVTERLIGVGGAFEHDWRARTENPMSLNAFAARGGILPRRPPSADVRDIGPGLVASQGSWQVTAAPAVHAQPWLDSLAYRFESPAGSIVFTGDTEPCESVIDLANGSDVLISMCYDDEERMERSGVAKGQSGPRRAAAMAAAAGVGTLVLVHQTPNMARPEEASRAVALAADGFDGRVIFADQLQRIDVARTPLPTARVDG